MKSIIREAREMFERFSYPEHSEKTLDGLFGPADRKAAEIDRVFEALLAFETLASLRLKFKVYFAGSKHANEMLEVLAEVMDDRVRQPRIASLRDPYS